MTPTETRAKELFKMVYPLASYEPWSGLPEKDNGWLKLGRYVLSLEAKLAKAKKRKHK